LTFNTVSTFIAGALAIAAPANTANIIYYKGFRYLNIAILYFLKVISDNNNFI